MYSTTIDTYMRDKNIAAILALLFGGFGVHRFYLGQWGKGLMYLLFSVTFVPFVIAFIDAIIFFSMRAEDFDLKHNRQHVDVVYRRPQQSYPTLAPSPYKELKVNKVQSRSSLLSKYNKEGVEKFKAYDFGDAKDLFLKAIEVHPQDAAAHYNLACVHSMMEMPEEAFRYLEQAVKFGFKDFDRIKTKDELAYLRIQPEFEAFVNNGYVMPTLILERREAAKKDPTPHMLEALDRLNYMREIGLVDDKEYQRQKEEILMPK